MKRNLFIVLVLILIGAGFMYMNSNTDFFKGETKFYDTKKSVPVEESTDHIIDLMFDPIEENLQALRNVLSNLKSEKLTEEDEKSYKELEEKYYSLRQEVLSRKIILIDFFNMSSIDSLKLKKVGEEFVLCDRNELKESFCKGLRDFGYTPESLQSLFGLEPYQEYAVEIKVNNSKNYRN